MSPKPVSDPKVLAPGEEWDATKPALAHAEATGVDIAEVESTGPGGTVTKGAVAAHAAGTTVASEASTAPVVTATISQSPQGIWAVHVFTDHPEVIDVSVNGKAIWRGIA
jgi:pyruvate/2-oxoglutarate dehydrogenase complex dihydrolipoamide acyltransferase (E2) component